MKEKVFQYGAYPRNNQIVSHSIEIEYLENGIYVYIVEKDDNDDSYDKVAIVLKIGDHFFEMGQCWRKTFELPQNQELAKRLVADYEGSVQENIEKNQNVSIMDVKIFEMLGKDTAPLFEYRKKKESERQAAREKRKQESVDKKQRQRDVDNNRIANTKQEYINGESISGRDFATICRRDGLDIHIRTIGTLNNSVSELNKEGRIQVWKERGKACPNTEGVRKLLKAYNAFLQTKE